MPELKQVLGAMVFASAHPPTVRQMRDCLAGVGQEAGGAAFAGVKESEILAALEQLATDMRDARCGVTLVEVAGGYRFQNDATCGPWLKHLLNAGRSDRLSRPALETLAIIAYRQPVPRADIEGVRGVAVDHILKTLMEIQLIRIVARSELPGRPFLYGTTQLFLEHFGLRGLEELKQMEPMLAAAPQPGPRRRPERAESQPPSAPGATQQGGSDEPGGPETGD
jgi:segregation and condensation protein B